MHARARTLWRSYGQTMLRAGSWHSRPTAPFCQGPTPMLAGALLDSGVAVCVATALSCSHMSLNADNNSAKHYGVRFVEKTD